MGEGGGGLLANLQQSFMSNSTYMMPQLPPIQNAVSAMGAIPQYNPVLNPNRRQYDEETLEMLSNEMSFNALYMHELHHKRMLIPDLDHLNYEDMHARAIWQLPPQNDDSSPLSPSAAGGSTQENAAARNISSTHTREALLPVNEASFKTADEDGSETELQELNRSNKEDQPLLPLVRDSSFNPTS